MFFCDNINIPGAQITPVDHRRNAIGPFDRRAGNIIPAEITASFMLDAIGRNHAFFQKWGSSIVYMGSNAAAAESQVDASTGAAFGELPVAAFGAEPEAEEEVPSAAAFLSAGV